MPKRRVTYAGKLEKQLSLYFKTDVTSDNCEDEGDDSDNENQPLRKNSSQFLLCDSSSTEDDDIEGETGGWTFGETGRYLIPTNEIEDALYSYSTKTVFIPTGDRQLNENYLFGDQYDIADPVDMINAASFGHPVKENALSRRARRRRRMTQRMNLSKNQMPRKGAFAARQAQLKSLEAEVAAPVEEKPEHRFEVRKTASGTQVFDYEHEETVINNLNDKTLAKFISEQSLPFGDEMELLTTISHYQNKTNAEGDRNWAGVDLYRLRLHAKAGDRNERSISPTRPVEGALLENVVGMVMEKYLSTQEMEAAHIEWRKLLTRQTCYERYLVRQWEQNLNDLITIQLKLVLSAMEEVSDDEDLHHGLTDRQKMRPSLFASTSSDIHSEVQEVMQQMNIGPIAVGQGTINGQDSETATTSDTGEDTTPITPVPEQTKRPVVPLKIPRPYTVAQNKRSMNLRYFAMIEKRPYKAVPDDLERLPPLTIVAYNKVSDQPRGRQMLKKTRSTGRMHIFDGAKLITRSLKRSRSDFPGGVLPDIHTAHIDFTEGCGEVRERQEGEVAVGDTPSKLSAHGFPLWPKTKKIVTKKVKRKKKKTRIKKKLPRFSMPIQRFGKKSRMNVNISLAMDGTGANIKATIRPDHHKAPKKVRVNVTIDIGTPEETDQEGPKNEVWTSECSPQKKKTNKRKKRKPSDGRENPAKKHLALPPRSPSRRSNHTTPNAKKKRHSLQSKPYVTNSPCSAYFLSPYQSPIQNVMSDPESRLRASNNQAAKIEERFGMRRSPSRSSLMDGDRIPSRRDVRDGTSHVDGSHTFTYNTPQRNHSYTDARSYALWNDMITTKYRKSDQTRIDQILTDARRRYNHDTSPLFRASEHVARKSSKSKRFCWELGRYHEVAASSSTAAYVYTLECKNKTSSVQWSAILTV